MHAPQADANRPRAQQIVLHGHVQGVGFRPFVYTLAQELHLSGWVQNQLGQVSVHVEGPADSLARFARDIVARAPPLSSPLIASIEAVEPCAGEGFEIVASSAGREARVFVPPDYFTCDDCARELDDPGDRRYRYPFINCTQCGPRYTLIRQMPYDRANTTMAGFGLCAQCRDEYTDPANRRFHAEPVACPQCGPRLVYRENGTEIAATPAALSHTVAALRDGKIVAVRGLGGYHLLCDATDEATVQRLRDRKHRPDKPLAVMFPLRGDDGLDAVRREVNPGADEARLLTSPMRPIVLCPRIAHGRLAAAIAPGLDEIGVFLPYSPLHLLLLSDFDGPLVATSANLSGEPVLTSAGQVDTRLTGIVDARLHHDRPIARPADDPVFRTIAGKPRPLRLGRGCTPLELTLPWIQPRPVLAVGAHMKNTVALSWDKRVVVSPHIGEMDTVRSVEVFEDTIATLQSLYGVRAEAVTCDAHPAYTSTRWALRSGLPVHRVLHHHAHASALAAEHGGGDNWLVFTWDGVGFGDDDTLWGGEAFYGGPGHWRRVATMRAFAVQGGDRAGREPWRSAAGLCWEAGLDWPGAPSEAALVQQAWSAGINTASTSAVGRLFDAAAALVLGIGTTSFEAQGPMLLEAVSKDPGKPQPLPLSRRADGLLETDWAPMLTRLLDDRRDPGQRGADFHATMAGAVCDQAGALAAAHRIERIGLAGGVFQNRVLSRLVMDTLAANGFEVCLGERLPCNDAAIAYGQAADHAAAS